MNLRTDDLGTAMLELAIFLPLLIVVLSGMFDYTLAIHAAMQVQEAAAAGAAFGAIPGNEGNLSGMQTAATAAAHGMSGFTVTAANLWTCSAGGASVSSTSSCSGPVTPYKYVVVNTSGTMPSMFNYPGFPSNGTLYGAAIFQVPWSQ